VDRPPSGTERNGNLKQKLAPGGHSDSTRSKNTYRNYYNFDGLGILLKHIRMGEKRNAYRILMGKPEGKRPLARPRRRWVDNMKMDLSEVGWDGVDWIDMAQNRDQWRALLNTVLNIRVP
jgi:hypothetical protein